MKRAKWYSPHPQGLIARRIVFLLVFLMLSGGATFLPRATFGTKPKVPLRPRPELTKTFSGNEAYAYAKARVLTLPENHPARKGYEQTLNRLRNRGLRTDLMLASRFSTRVEQRLTGRISNMFWRSLGREASAQTQHSSDGTYDVYATPFESDSQDGTAEFNIYSYDSDTGGWMSMDIQLITHDDAPEEYEDASSGWNENVAFFDCGAVRPHASNSPLKFFVPDVEAQSWQGISCKSDYQLSVQLLREVRNGVGVGVATAFGSWAGRLCRYTGPGFWGCVGTNGWVAGSAYILYEFGSFIGTCRCRYAGGPVGWACI